MYCEWLAPIRVVFVVFLLRANAIFFVFFRFKIAAVITDVIV